jgi:hypothetical protein
MTGYLAQTFERPYYAHCVWNAAVLGKRLGHSAISVVEFGVAGGNGLVLLEKYAMEVSDELGIEIEVYGFDTAEGLPPPDDYRDMPYYWQPGFYKMDEEALRKRLTHAKLVLGDIRETSKTFFEEYKPAPLAAVFHDMDFYSATKAGLEMFHADERYRLPRIFCFFDDIFGDELTLCSDFTGERLAINEFNQINETKKISRAYYLDLWQVFPGSPHIFIFHDFAHSRYNDFVGVPNQQLPLNPGS